MKITVEMSLYPLATEYLPIIEKTVARLNAESDVTVVTNAMSTQISGDFEKVTALINREVKATFESTGKAVFVCKYLNGELNL
ncbi:YkoF family thiamine/hydroxymethylpyrimidine-binding protein [Alteromonas sp. a30]|uniref:YkoF family thiamine/hydroxymethylpyrimidine-binding protein n=1 Tax=Alteromonas sp. a30 TaxID=2730917 RepID=UPI002281ED76|nr:YkoF family thiamine/hydroxymethylpyrimidine-binding protein [Alteromonas sp. a30]MCY7295283.1 hypothetical protein [Alteromonas sp. a30]